MKQAIHPWLVLCHRADEQGHCSFFLVYLGMIVFELKGLKGMQKLSYQLAQMTKPCPT
jgi:hypothetical protein